MAIHRRYYTNCVEFLNATSLTADIFSKGAFHGNFLETSINYYQVQSLLVNMLLNFVLQNLSIVTDNKRNRQQTTSQQNVHLHGNEAFQLRLVNQKKDEVQCFLSQKTLQEQIMRIIWSRYFSMKLKSFYFYVFVTQDGYDPYYRVQVMPISP